MEVETQAHSSTSHHTRPRYRRHHPASTSSALPHRPISSPTPFWNYLRPPPPPYFSGDPYPYAPLPRHAPYSRRPQHRRMIPTDLVDDAHPFWRYTHYPYPSLSRSLYSKFPDGGVGLTDMRDGVAAPKELKLADECNGVLTYLNPETNFYYAFCRNDDNPPVFLPALSRIFYNTSIPGDRIIVAEDAEFIAKNAATGGVGGGNRVGATVGLSGAPSSSSLRKKRRRSDEEGQPRAEKKRK
ncbi:hypothetical protein SpCBS45565_g08234 [Spizellomyces sp. 'palustris']|nr:hypothetical protein SpCBS45565_g08234 [Spizellomyces sp. 'palustris']